MTSGLYAAELTPPGRGAIATIRLCGAGAVAAVDADLRTRNGRPLAAAASDQLVVGNYGPAPGEEVVVRRCDAEVVEIHCHGGTAAAAWVLKCLAARGAAPIGWQAREVDTQPDRFAAAALAALARAPTGRTAAILLDQYRGALGRAITAIERALTDDERPRARALCDQLLAQERLGRHLVEPWRVVIVGRPNVGKSSLLNALAGHSRAIVHDRPGTTRDVVTAVTAIDGWPVELADTAGLRTGGEAVEQLGMARARTAAAAADLALLVADRSAAWTDDDEQLRQELPAAMFVANKCDLPPATERFPRGVAVSAKTGQGIEELLREIAARLAPDPPESGTPVPFTDAQVDEIRRLRALGG